MPNGKKSISRQSSANESATDSSKYPATPPAVSRAGTNPCSLPLKVQHWKGTRHRPNNSGPSAEDVGHSHLPSPCTPDCTSQQHSGEGSWGTKQVSAHGQGLNFQLHSHPAELQRILPRCALPESSNCMKADIMLLFILLLDSCEAEWWAGLGYIQWQFAL